jgi:hypothetical protein
MKLIKHPPTESYLGFPFRFHPSEKKSSISEDTIFVDKYLSFLFFATSYSFERISVVAAQLNWV